MEKIGFGGGCHWCTEAVFLSLKGILQVEQGWIAATENKTFSEAVIVHYNPEEIDLSALIAVHLHTHSSTVNHSMRHKYRSAIYTFEEEQQPVCAQILIELQADFDTPLVTEVLSFHDFRSSVQEELDYYYKNPSKPFCETHIQPKLKLLMERFPVQVNVGKISARPPTNQTWRVCRPSEWILPGGRCLFRPANLLGFCAKKCRIV